MCYVISGFFLKELHFSSCLRASSKVYRSLEKKGFIQICYKIIINVYGRHGRKKYQLPIPLRVARQYHHALSFVIVLYSKCKRNVQWSYWTMILRMLPRPWNSALFVSEDLMMHAVCYCAAMATYWGKCLKESEYRQHSYASLGISPVLDMEAKVLYQVCWWIK